jgi:hypothetical protein
MTLSFPNESRSFDASRTRVRFWGHDGAMEISFFLEADALHKLGAAPDTSSSETAFLNVFDAARERIYQAAAKAHARRADGSYSYSLAASDF